MNRLQSIENALISINQAAFQELCDSFLILRNSNYSAFSRIGSQNGKLKTIKGTPDTLLLLPSGQYIFVEYSTNISAGISKLKDDIKKCIDSNNTGISKNQIIEIILCLNYKVKPNELQLLKELLINTRIILTVFDLDSLALELHLNHHDLTNYYLGLPIDTGQIVSIDRFIDEYNNVSKGIATPINNPFLHREKELKEFKHSLLENDFIILTGAPGIGKTKFAIEGIKSFLSDNLSYKAYCVSYKNHTLLDDLFKYFDSENDYLLFVDDANRIDAFSQITGFYRSTRKGKLKVIITVRDYAFQEIGILCQDYEPSRIELFKLTDKQIIDIIKSKPFQILNPDYQNEIVRIADGNPRIAIMTAYLAIAKQDIHALFDVSVVFEKYFSTFIKDDGEFASEVNIKCLGLIAFFYTIPYKDKVVTSSILENFGLDYSTFIDVIDKLDKLELVEIQFEHVKIPEQNLSTYFFYKTFIKDSLLSFQILLKKYFDSNSNRFRDCVIPANNTFGHENVMDKLRPYLQIYLKTIGDEERIFKYLMIFWFYLQNETLEFIYSLVNKLPSSMHLDYNVSYENNAFSYKKNNVIELLSEFFRSSNNLKVVIELAFEYVRKNPEHLPELIFNIRDQLSFDEDDQRFGFVRQITLFQSLENGVKNNDLLYVRAFFELSKTFLSFKFHHTKGGRNHSFYWYDFPIPNCQIIRYFRQNIWNVVKANYDRFPDYSFNLIQTYASVSPDVTKVIMEHDLPYLVDIIDSHLSPESFEHCKYVHDQIRWCKRNSVTNPNFKYLLKKFSNAIYEIFLIIDWDRLRNKESLDFVNYHDFEKLKEAEIRKSLVFRSITEIRSFFDVFLFLFKTAKEDYNYTTSLDYILDENFINNFNLGCQFLSIIIEHEHEINYIPRTVFRTQLNSIEKANEIWNVIHSVTFKHKSLWELSFFESVDDSLINKVFIRRIINSISEITESYTLHFNRFERYLSIEPNFFQILLHLIFEKNTNNNNNITIKVWSDFFETYYNYLGNEIEIIKRAYIQQDKIQNHFDYDGKGFFNILKDDSNFLIDYVENLFADNKHGLAIDHRNLSFIWQIEGINYILENVFDMITKKDKYYGIREHLCNIFFENIQTEYKSRANQFLIEYCTKNYNNITRMNAIVDIVRHSMKDLFEEILLLFISLNQDVNVFKKIWWRGNGGTYSGDVIIGDIEASQWKNILSIVEKSEIGYKLIPIKSYINERVESSLRSGDWERKRRFLERY